MRKVGKFSVLFAVLVAIFGLSLTSCGSSASSLEGRAFEITSMSMGNNSASEVYCFDANGVVRLESRVTVAGIVTKATAVKGTYSVKGKRLTITIGGVSSSANFKISGKKLILTGDDGEVAEWPEVEY